MTAIGNILRGDGLKARTARSTILTFVSFGGDNVIRLASNLILTRLLFPEAFGLMVLVSMVAVALTMFSDLGLRPAIVQSKRDDAAFLDTAWVLQIARGAILWLVGCALAVPAAAYFNAPELAAMIPVAAFGFVILGLSPTRLALLTREMTYGRITVINLAVPVVTLGFNAAAAALTGSVWALVAGLLFGNALLVLAQSLLMPGRANRLQFERAAFDELFGFGKWLTLSSAAAFLRQQGDVVLLGRYLSLADLALYNIATVFTRLPTSAIERLSDQVMLGLYRNRPPADSPENRRRIGLARGALVLGGQVSLIALALIGEALVILLYDPRYEGAGAMLTLLAVARMPRIGLMTYGPALLAAGRSRAFSTVSVVDAAVQMALMLIGLSLYGFVGLLAAIWAAPFLVYPLLARRVAEVKALEVWQDAAFFGLAIAMSVVVVRLHWETMAGYLGG